MKYSKSFTTNGFFTLLVLIFFLYHWNVTIYKHRGGGRKYNYRAPTNPYNVTHIHKNRTSTHTTMQHGKPSMKN